MTKKTLGFLDLPPEVRIPIYEELLVNRDRWYGFQPSTNTWVKPKVSTKSIISIRGSRSGNGPCSLGLCPANFGGWKIDYQTPDPAILSTCKTISAEALPILYRDNDFDFGCGDSEDLGLLSLGINLKEPCRDIFNHDAQNERDSHFTELLSFDFAAFLNQIGQANAASIRSLKLYAPDADIMAEYMPVFTELLVRHLPGIRDLNIVVLKASIPYDESPDYWHPDRSSPFWHNGEFWPLYHGLNSLVERVHWLRKFEYGGQEDFAEEDSWSWLAKLEQRVKSRNQPRADTCQEFDSILCTSLEIRGADANSI